jgi:predicted anti-sigma-YlaC factor YlaD
MPASRRTEAAERRAAFWRTPGGRVLGVVSFVVLGLLGTRQLITHSTAALVAFGIFVLVTVALSLSQDPRARVGVIGVLGIYFAVAGFAHFGGLHNTFTGSLGIFLVVITFALLVAMARQHGQLGARLADGGRPGTGQ